MRRPFLATSLAFTPDRKRGEEAGREEESSYVAAGLYARAKRGRVHLWHGGVLSENVERHTKETGARSEQLRWAPTPF